MEFPPDDSYSPNASESAGAEERRRLLDERFTQLYKDIRHLAARVRWSGTNPTLNPTALAHEAYLKLCNQPPDLASKCYDEIISIFANVMLQILRDAARRKNARKREIKELPEPADIPVDEALIIAEALDCLSREHPLRAQVAQCRFLFGMTTIETADALNISGRKVERVWQEVKVQLSSQFKTKGAGAP